MTVGVISLCGFRKELTGAFYSSSDAIIRPTLAQSSMTTSQNSSDLVSYAISKAPPKRQQPNYKKS
jgi:hypothetical protein